MRTKSLTSVACLIAAALLVLPACGGDDAQQASEPIPPDQVQGVERRVSDLEKELFKLRKDLEGVRNERSAPEDAGTDGAANGAAAAGSDTADADAGAAGAGAGSGSGSGPGSGSGGGSRSGGGDEGGGPDPGSPEDDPGIRDICGDNPAPTC